MDKNNIEIYTGDTVKLSNGMIGTIIYNEDNQQYQLEIGTGVYEILAYKPKELEVINSIKY